MKSLTPSETPIRRWAALLLALAIGVAFHGVQAQEAPTAEEGQPAEDSVAVEDAETENPETEDAET